MPIPYGYLHKDLPLNRINRNILFFGSLSFHVTITVFNFIPVPFLLKWKIAEVNKLPKGYLTSIASL